MPARSIIPEILAKLEPYLELLDRQWESQAEGCRTPTLPHDKGQVNVRAITKAVGLRQSQELQDWRDEHGSKRETSLARHSFHLSETSSSMSGPAHPSRSWGRPRTFSASASPGEGADAAARYIRVDQVGLSKNARMRTQSPSQSSTRLRGQVSRSSYR
jgi:hypothetical protein